MMSLVLGLSTIIFSAYGLTHWSWPLPKALGILFFLSFGFGGAVAVLAGILSLKK